MFHLNGKANRYYMHKMNTESPHITLEHRIEYFSWNIRSETLFLQRENTDGHNIHISICCSCGSFQQGVAPSHWQNEVLRNLNEKLPHRWIGRYFIENFALFNCPPRSSDLMVYDLFLLRMHLRYDLLFTNSNNALLLLWTALLEISLQRKWSKFEYRKGVSFDSRSSHRTFEIVQFKTWTLSVCSP